MRIKGKVWILMCCFIFSACINDEVNDHDCSSNIPSSTDNFRSDEILFELGLNDTSNFLVIGEDISLKVENLSDYEIWFPEDLNLLLVESTGDFEGVFLENLLPIPSTDYIILGKSGFSDDTFEFTVRPNLSDYGKSVNVDFLIIGYIYRNGEICSEKYGSLLSLEILPNN